MMDAASIKTGPKPVVDKSVHPEVQFGRSSYVITLGRIPPFTFTAHTSDDDAFISKTIAELGVWEPFETEVLCRLFPIFGTFVDLGANIGWYSALASRGMRPGSRIHAFEPDVRNFQLLETNVTEERQVFAQLNRVAVSRTVGTTRLFYAINNLGDHRLYQSTEDRVSIDVPVTTLDAYFDDGPRACMLVKSDTQGSECKIALGGRRFFSQLTAGSALIIEFWPFGIANSGETATKLIDELARLPQSPFIISHAQRSLIQTTWEDLSLRSEGDLCPDLGSFVDLILLTPGSPAYLAVAEWISTS